MDLKENKEKVAKSYPAFTDNLAQELHYFSSIVESLPKEDDDTVKLLGKIFFDLDAEEGAKKENVHPGNITTPSSTAISRTILGKRDISQKIPKEKNFRVIRRPKRDNSKTDPLTGIKDELAPLRLLMQLAEYALSGKSFHISEISRVVRGFLGGNTVELKPIPVESFRELLKGDACLTTFMRVLLTHPPLDKHGDAWICSRYAVLYSAPHYFSPWHYPLWEGICSGDMSGFKKFVMENPGSNGNDKADYLVKLLSITTYVFDRKTN